MTCTRMGSAWLGYGACGSIATAILIRIAAAISIGKSQNGNAVRIEIAAAGATVNGLG